MLVIMVLVSLTIMMIDIRCNCKDKISQCIYNSTMTIYYADDTIVTYDKQLQRYQLMMDDSLLLLAKDIATFNNQPRAFMSLPPLHLLPIGILNNETRQRRR